MGTVLNRDKGGRGIVALRRLKKVGIWTLVIVLIVLLWNIIPSQQGNRAPLVAKADFEPVVESIDENSYPRYLEKYANADRPNRTIRIEGEDFIEVSSDEFVVEDGYMGLDGTAVLTPENGSILGESTGDI